MTNNPKVEIKEGIYTCKAFAEFMKDVINNEYTGINYNNFEHFNYNRNYNIISNRFSVETCYKELKSVLQPSELWGTGCRYNVGNSSNYIYINFLFADNIIGTDGNDAMKAAFQYYIPNKEEMNKRLKNIKEKYKNVSPFNITIKDTIAMAKL